jgi:hypothetical protein
MIEDELVAADTAIDGLARQEFLQVLNGDYQRLRNDPELWEQYLAEPSRVGCTDRMKIPKAQANTALRYR